MGPSESPGSIGIPTWPEGTCHRGGLQWTRHLCPIRKQYHLVTKPASPILYSVARILLLFSKNFFFKEIFSIPVPCRLFFSVKFKYSLSYSSQLTLHSLHQHSHFMNVLYSGDCQGSIHILLLRIFRLISSPHFDENLNMLTCHLSFACLLDYWFIVIVAP